MHKTMNVFIGFDAKEEPAYHTLCSSILRYASRPVRITPVKLSMLTGFYSRPRGVLESTEFSISRFLVPYLSDFKGVSLFMDCDMLCVADIAELFDLADADYQVQVVKKQIRPNKVTKMLGERQTDYDKKLWSAVMLFNNPQCRKLEVGYVSRAPGLQLHQFKWCYGDDQIGELPQAWQYVIPYDDPKDLDEAKIIHFTEGGPWWKKYRDIPCAEMWHKQHNHVVSYPDENI